MKKATKPVMFISYNHKDKDLHDIIINYATNTSSDKIKFISDHKLQDLSSSRVIGLHQGISKLINEAHVVVPIITRNWLSSEETRDELIRAHERKKRIVILASANDRITKKDMPHYISDELYIEFSNDNINSKISELINRVLNFNDYWKHEIYDQLNIILADVNRINSAHIFKKEHLFDIVEQAKKTINDVINKNKFESAVSYEQNFLVSASPYFRSSNEIIAVTIAKISTFWTDFNVKTATNRYLKEQSETGKRL